jgi:hypothetical protein
MTKDRNRAVGERDNPLGHWQSLWHLYMKLHFFLHLKLFLKYFIRKQQNFFWQCGFWTEGLFCLLYYLSHASSSFCFSYFSLGLSLVCDPPTYAYHILRWQVCTTTACLLWGGVGNLANFLLWQALNLDPPDLQSSWDYRHVITMPSRKQNTWDCQGSFLLFKVVQVMQIAKSCGGVIRRQ